MKKELFTIAFWLRMWKWIVFAWSYPDRSSNLMWHARREFKALGYDLTDKTEGPNKWMSEGVLDLIAVFAQQGHSGFSAPHCVDLFEKLARFQPLCPLTGADDEWVEVSKDVWQNNRCSHVFAEPGLLGSKCYYDMNGRIFREPNGACYTNRDSRVDITFPYTPKREYMDVPASVPDESMGNVLTPT